MGLFDINRPGGLFGGIYKERPGYQTPGIGDGLRDGIDAETQDAINTYAAMPKGKQGKGGFLGTGYDGEDIMSMLLRAAAIAQGDYASGAAFGENIGARARKAAEEAAKRQAELQDYEAKKVIDARFAGPKEMTEYAQALVEQGLTPGTLEFQAAMRQYNTRRADPIVTTTLPGNRFYSGPSSGLPNALGGVAGGGDDATPTVEDGHAYTPGPGGRANPSNWKPTGGGVSNDTSNFRVNIPRLRP